jgi:hypothetical protein
MWEIVTRRMPWDELNNPLPIEIQELVEVRASVPFRVFCTFGVSFCFDFDAQSCKFRVAFGWLVGWYSTN